MKRRFVTRLLDPSSAEPDADDSYWRRPPGEHLATAYWDDPRPDLQGQLTSEQILYYNDACTLTVAGGMIRPFEEENLKPASYNLTLGRRCVVEGEDVFLTKAAPWLEIPPNSLAVVPMQQVLCLPHYMIGRFNLEIRFVYQGLLLGTGPQVDPGFQGALSCPLHNISNQPIRIQWGEVFAKIDFTKTATRAKDVIDAFKEVPDEAALRAAARVPSGRAGALPVGVQLFKKGDHTWTQPVHGYLERRPTSSVRPLQRRLDRYRNFGLIGLLATALGVLGTILAAANLARNGLASERIVTENDAALRREVVELERRLVVTQTELRRLQRGSATTSPNRGTP